MRAENRTGTAIYLILTLLPLCAGAIYALGYSFGLFGLLSTGFTTDHWTALLTDDRFYIALGFSIWIAVASMVIAVSLALLFVARYPEKWQDKLGEWGLYLPLTYPAIVVAFISFQFLAGSGLLSRISFVLGLTSGIDEFPGWIQDPFGIGIILMHSGMATPFLTLYFLHIWRKEGLDGLLDLSGNLGASWRQQVQRIILPVLLKRAKPMLVLYTIFIAGAYEAPLVLGSQHPRMITLFIVHKVNRFDLSERPQAYAAICVVVLLIAVLLFAGPGRTLKKEALW